MSYHVQCNCGKYLSGRKEIIICPDCGQKNSVVAEVPLEQNEGVHKKSPRPGRPRELAVSEPRLPNPDAATLRYPQEVEKKRDKELQEAIEHLARGQRR